jgi:hypothetical protein
MAYNIKCKLKTEKRYAFLTSSGGCNHLRVHAARFETKEKAQAVIDENAADNPEWDFKVQEA